jgi:molybdopterin converting factor small subunit
MTVAVRLFATLREGRGKEIALEAPEGASPLDIARTMGIHEKDIAILLVNGRDADPGKSLAEGDRISLFPPVGGG